MGKRLYSPDRKKLRALFCHCLHKRWHFMALLHYFLEGTHEAQRSIFLAQSVCSPTYSIYIPGVFTVFKITQLGGN